VARKYSIVGHERTHKKETEKKGSSILVAVDFSNSAKAALRKAKSLLTGEYTRIVALHVIDHHFVDQCIYEHLGTKKEIKKKLFISAKNRLRDFLLKEGMDLNNLEMVVCEGTPCVEINKKAVQSDADMIVMGSQGHSGEMKNIFFGSTTERVLRFIRRPVLCVPPEENHEQSKKNIMGMHKELS
jgi:nucleotide-binding universal stress UspA family protein